MIQKKLLIIPNKNQSSMVIVDNGNIEFWQKAEYNTFSWY